MILAAGLGTRLRPLTDRIPKALVPIAGKPLLQHTLETLIIQGASSAIINVHHHAAQIIRYMEEHPCSIPTFISDESTELLNTGGGIRHALPLMNEEGPVLIHNVDILSNANLRDFYERNKKNPATLLVSPRPSTRQLIVREGLLVGWTNLTTGEIRGSADGEQYAFSGIHLYSPTLGRKTMSSGKWPAAFSIIDYYLDECQHTPIHVEVDSNLRLLDVGKVDSLQQAEDMLKNLQKK